MAQVLWGVERNTHFSTLMFNLLIFNYLHFPKYSHITYTTNKSKTYEFSRLYFPQYLSIDCKRNQLNFINQVVLKALNILQGRQNKQSYSDGPKAHHKNNTVM